MSATAIRVVSLVPSATETLLALGVTPVACTRFCEQPSLHHVGGTKDPKVEEVVALDPDLVVVNDEENRIEDVEALRRAGLPLHEMSPRSVADVGPAVAALADAVDAQTPHPFDDWDGWLGRWPSPPAGRRRRAFVPIWRRPWMTLAGDTYGSSLLALLGWENVFAGEERRYPEVTLDDAAAHGPDVVLLPSEPYPFKERHVGAVRDGVPGAEVLLVDGQDLFWWGIRTPAAAGRLMRVLPAG